MADTYSYDAMPVAVFRTPGSTTVNLLDVLKQAFGGSGKLDLERLRCLSGQYLFRIGEPAVQLLEPRQSDSDERPAERQGHPTPAGVVAVAEQVAKADWLHLKGEAK